MWKHVNCGHCRQGNDEGMELKGRNVWANKQYPQSYTSLHLSYVRPSLLFFPESYRSCWFRESTFMANHGFKFSSRLNGCHHFFYSACIWNMLSVFNITSQELFQCQPSSWSRLAYITEIGMHIIMRIVFNILTWRECNLCMVLGS